MMKAKLNAWLESPWPLWTILALALALRLLVTREHMQSPLFTFLRLDEFEYDGWAREAASGRWFLDFVPNHGPGYSWLLGLLYLFLGYHLLIPRLLQIGLGLGSIGLAFLITREIAGRKEALGSAAVFAFYWPPIVFEQRILAVSLFVFLDLLFLLLAVRAAAKKSTPLWALAGFILGLSAIVRPTSLAWLAAFLLWMIIRAVLAREPRLGLSALIFLAATLIPLAPVLLKNHELSGRWSVVQMDSALNLYLGNNPESDGTPYARRGGTWDRIEALPVKEAGITDLGAQERFYAKKVIEFKRDRPAAFFALLAKKVLLLVNRREVRATIDPEFHRTLFKALALPLPGFALVLALALPGLLALKLSRLDHQLLLLYILAYVAAVAGTVVASRYRLPFTAGLIILAGPGLGKIAASVGRLRDMRGGRAKLNFVRAALPLALFGVGLGVAYLPVGPHYTAAEEWAYLGDAWAEAKNPAAAFASYQRALALSPRHPDAMMGIARLQADRGDLEGSIQWFEKAAATDPDNAAAHQELGLKLWKAGRMESALRELQMAVECRPQWLPGLESLALVEAQMGRREEARKHLQAILDIWPRLDDIRALLNRLGPREPPPKPAGQGAAP